MMPEVKEASDHKCLIYEGQPSEQLRVVVPFLANGLENNWRCLCLGSPGMIDMVDSALRIEGIDTHRRLQEGSLILSSDQSHLDGGTFHPERLIAALTEMIDAAVRDGFEGLCATGDMRWELGADPNFDLLADYEARLERLFREKRLRGICQYHRDRIPSQAMRDALVTHRSVYIGSVLNSDNCFYIPPELLSGPDGATRSKQGDWMYRQIARVVAAEHNRDEAMRSLEASEARQRNLAGQLDRANHDLERRVKERTSELESFMHSVSHDLRAPLRAIAGFGEILAEDCAEALGAEGRKHLDRMLASAHHMGELIEGLLVLSRISKMDMTRAPVDMTAIATEIARDMRESEPGRAADFVIRPGMRAMGDPALLRNALANLIGNAWKFTSKRPRTRIEIGEEQDPSGAPVFFVRDNGAGFEMQYAERLFGAFQRFHSQQDFPGTGIGLATVKRIVAKHGGRIWAEAGADKGATFFFALPDDLAAASPAVRLPA